MRIYCTSMDAVPLISLVFRNKRQFNHDVMIEHFLPLYGLNENQQPTH